MAITDWPADERPREKLQKLGAQALSDAELLAVFLRVGVVGKSAVDLARDLVTHFGSLNRLFAASAQEFSSIKGMGEAKYSQLQAVLEMAKRALAEQLKEKLVLSSPTAVKDYLRLTLAAKTHEVFMCLYLDAQNRLIASEELFRGSLTQTSVYPREIAKQALFHNAAGAIFAHNHPSGIAEPSAADHHLTRQLSQTLNLLDIKVLDHFIVAGNTIYSFAEAGKLQG